MPFVSIKRHIRFHHIHCELAAQRYPSPEKLAEALGTSQKTVKRLLKAMREELGADIAYDPLLKGYYYIKPPQVPIPSPAISPKKRIGSS